MLCVVLRLIMSRKVYNFEASTWWQMRYAESPIIRMNDGRIRTIDASCPSKRVST